MKSAYELAMERLSKQAPTVRVTAAQKDRLADLESRYKAKVAERELGLTEAIHAAINQGNQEEAETLREQLAHEKRKLAEELEEKKEAVRGGR